MAKFICLGALLGGSLLQMVSPAIASVVVTRPHVHVGRSSSSHRAPGRYYHRGRFYNHRYFYGGRWHYQNRGRWYFH
jgi:hypothetical protein